MSPVLKLVSGIVGAVICLGFVLVAHNVGLDLDKTLESGLIVGGALSAGVSIYGARQMPVKEEEPKP